MKIYAPDFGPLYQNEIWNRSKIIQHCIDEHSYESYLEIGFGDSANPNNNWPKISAPKKVCVDPWDTTPDFVLKMTSDEFFRSNTETFDVVFIDGDHRAEQVYKDILNSLEVLNPGGIILTHDNSPRNIDEESPNVSGDGWKAITFLRQREDLDICVVPADTGVSMIRKSENRNILRAGDCARLRSFLSGKEPDFSKVDFGVLEDKRVDLLNLLSIDLALEWLQG